MRVKRGVVARRRRNKFLKRAKGYRGAGSRLYTVARERGERALAYAYRDRKNRKRDFSALWIQRINALVRQNGLSYSQFMRNLKMAGVTLNRKILAEIALFDSEGFYDLIKETKQKASFQLSP